MNILNEAPIIHSTQQNLANFKDFLDKQESNFK